MEDFERVGEEAAVICEIGSRDACDCAVDDLFLWFTFLDIPSLLE